MSRRKIYFFSNGFTVVSDKSGLSQESPECSPASLYQSTPAFQVPWIRVFADILAKKGESPGEFEVYFPDGKKGWIFWNDDPDCYDPPGNWDWKIVDPP
jgi:hypothetical protein